MAHVGPQRQKKWKKKIHIVNMWDPKFCLHIYCTLPCFKILFSRAHDGRRWRKRLAFFSESKLTVVDSLVKIL